MNKERFSKQIEFLLEVDKLKQVFRNTILIDKIRNENDAEHSWHMALAAVIFIEYVEKEAGMVEIDVAKVLKMALIHDIVEIDAGDIFAYADYDPNEKLANERKAASRVFGILPEDQAKIFIDLWEEFEAGETNESIYAQALDRFMPIMHNYFTQGQQWRRYNVTSEQVLQKNKRIEKCSKELWDYIKHLVADAVQKGYLRE